MDSAWLSIALQFRRTEQKAAKTIGAYELLRSWNERQRRFARGLRRSTGGCRRVPTGNLRVIPADTWAVAGAAARQRLCGRSTGFGHHRSRHVERCLISFDATASVKKWLTEPESNCGWLLRETLISPANGILNFYASENRNAVMRPVLSIAAGAMMLCSSLSAGCRGGRKPVRPLAGKRRQQRQCLSGSGHRAAPDNRNSARLWPCKAGRRLLSCFQRSGSCHLLCAHPGGRPGWSIRIECADQFGCGGCRQIGCRPELWLLRRLCGGRLRAILPFEHDLNRNSSVFISCRPAGGDWSTPNGLES